MSVTKVYVNGKEIGLSDKQHYVAEGGEGRIYAIKDTAFKIYIDPHKMIPKGKIQELVALDHPSIIRPINLIYDKNQSLIGYTMTYCRKTVELCRLFNTVFLNENSITSEVLQKLVSNIQKSIDFIHNHGCLIVDGKDKNYLSSTNDYSIPFLIDVNAWQTKSFKANAYTPLFTEPGIKAFDKLSDWFSFGIIVCKIFTGIHPFRGGHPDYDKKDVIPRMKDKVSIFNRNTRLPVSVRDLSFIPAAYMDWMFRMFEKGERIPPPTAAGMLKIVQVVEHLIKSTGNFNIDLFRRYEGKIIRHRNVRNKSIVQTTKGLYVNKDKLNIKTRGKLDIVLSPKSLIPLIVSIHQSKSGLPLLTFRMIKDDGSVEVLPFPLASEQFMVVDNQVHSLFKGSLTEIEVGEMGSKPIVSVVTPVREVMPKASRMFDGLIYQKLFGKAYLVIPHRRQGKSYCEIKPIPELDEYRIIDGKHDSGVCMLIGEKGGRYDKLILRFKDYRDYDVRVVEDIDQPVLNFVVLDTGIVVSIDEHAEMEVFLSKPGSPKLKHIIDKEIKTEMFLTKDGGSLMFYQDSYLYKMKMTN